MNLKKTLSFTAAALTTLAMATGCVKVEGDTKVDSEAKFSGTLSQTLDSKLLTGMADSFTGQTAPPTTTDEAANVDKLVEKLNSNVNTGNPNVTIKWEKTADANLTQVITYINSTSEEINTAMKTADDNKPDNSNGNVSSTTTFPWEAKVDGDNLIIELSNNEETGEQLGLPSSGSGNENMTPEQQEAMMKMFEGFLGDSGMKLTLTTPGPILGTEGALSNAPGITLNTYNNTIIFEAKLTDIMKAYLANQGKPDVKPLVITAAKEANGLMATPPGTPEPSAPPVENPKTTKADNSDSITLMFLGLGALILLALGLTAVIVKTKKSDKNNPTGPNPTEETLNENEENPNQQ